MQTSADAARSGRGQGPAATVVKQAHNSLTLIGLLSVSDSFEVLVLTC